MRFKKPTEQCRLEREIKEASAFNFKPNLIAKRREFSEVRSPEIRVKQLYLYAKKRNEKRERL